jgi:hypothetical protein
VVLDHKHKRANCILCQSSVSMNGIGQLKLWLQSACLVLPKTGRPEFVPSTCTKLGKQFAHKSHAICIHRGLLFCNNCGMRSLAKFHLLAKMCPGSAKGSIHGTRTLEAIKADKVPFGLRGWPEDA